jgi:arylsulfatase A-like enzyme
LFQRAYELAGHSGLPLRTEADWRRMIANYWGLCSLVDTHVGTILEALAACGLDEHTIVVYSSDHGDMMGSHRLLAKCVQYEEALRVPLLVRLPGQTRGQTVTAPVSQIDLLPTLLDYMGQPLPAHLEGESLRPLMEGRPDAAPRDVFVEWSGHNNGFGDVIGRVVPPPGALEVATEDEISAAITDPVRTVVTADGWKLNVSARGEHELYHLAEDPYERLNLAGEAAARKRFDELAGRIRAWQARTGDEVELG